MKYLVKFFVVTFTVLICTHGIAQQNVAYLDMKYILNNSKAGKGAQDFLKKSLNEKQKKFKATEEALKKEERNLLEKKESMSKEEYKKNTDTLRKKVIAYQSDRRSSLDKIAQLRLDARSKLIKKLNPILASYLEENNISLVIDKKDVVLGNTNLDITKIIVDKLNKELPSLNLK